MSPNNPQASNAVLIADRLTIQVPSLLIPSSGLSQPSLPFCGTAGRGTNFCPGIATTGGRAPLTIGGGADTLGIGGGAVAGADAEAIRNPGVGAGGGAGGGVDVIGTGADDDAILNPGSGVTAVGAGMAAAAGCDARFCSMLLFANSVPSAPQFGQATRAGIRPCRGSTSKANFWPQLHCTFTVI